MRQQRREFLRLMLNGSMATALSPMLLPREVFASTSNDFSDYKALVYISLLGGNDAFNMLVPTGRGGDAGYDNYADIRSNLVVSHDDLSPAMVFNGGQLNLGGGNPYDGTSRSNSEVYRKGLYHINGTGVGVNGVMPEMARLMNDGKLAAIASVGTLVEPVLDPDTMQRFEGAPLPEQLFAHNHQRKLQETGQADNSMLYGWIGRLFDEWQGVNGPGIITQNISFSGNNHSLVGRDTVPIKLSTNPKGYSSRRKSDVETRQRLAGINSANPFMRLYDNMVGQSFRLADEIADVWANARTFTTPDSYGNTLFSAPDGAVNMSTPPGNGLIKRLEAVSKMIEYGRDAGLKRQVFYVAQGGYDTHSGQLNTHPKLLRELSMGLDKFQKAMEEIGVSDQVTTFTLSDFGRSVANNGDGTDHAWAGHNLAMGGAVNGGNVYGDLPDLTLSGAQDKGRNGRMIPTISIDQQLATLLNWFGVDAQSALMNDLFPNLKNFDGTRYGRNIGFMKA